MNFIRPYTIPFFFFFKSLTEVEMRFRWSGIRLNIGSGKSEISVLEYYYYFFFELTAVVLLCYLKSLLCSNLMHNTSGSVQAIGSWADCRRCFIEGVWLA